MNIEPNFDVMLWIIFIFMIIKAIAYIFAGALGMEKDKSKHYGAFEVIGGIISLILIAIILLT